MWLVELRNLALCLGALLNLLVISVPLVFVDIQIQEYFSRPVVWIYYFLLTIFCLVEGWGSLRVPNEEPNAIQKHSLPYLIGLLVLFIFWVSIYDFVEVFQIHLLQIVSGSLLVSLGIAIRLCSILKLKKYFVSHIALITNHQLVTTGIYSFVRHPSELGLLSICFGVAILLSSLKAILIGILILFPLIIYRVLLEDKLLQLKFGLTHHIYRSATPILFPRLITFSASKVLHWTSR